MKNTPKDKTKARGGLAAEAAQETPAAKASKKAQTTETDAPSAKGRCGQLCGYSITSAVRTLGEAGVGIAHAMEILKANGITAAPATIAASIRVGAKGEGKCNAPLTKAQIAELKASAVDPQIAKDEAKAAKAAAAATAPAVA